MPGRFQLMSSLPICYIFSFVLLIFDQLIGLNRHVFVLEIDIQIPRRKNVGLNFEKILD